MITLDMEPPPLTALGSRQVVDSGVFQIQPRCLNIKPFSIGKPRLLACSSQPVHSRRFPAHRLAAGRFVFLLFPKRPKTEHRAREISTQNYRPHIAMSCNPIIAWVSVANMPTAPGLHVRPWLSNRTGLTIRGCRERLKKYTTPYFPQRI